VAPKARTLGDYLRARREQVRPEDVGLVAGAGRRVPGLRREELAMLAGISAEYYLRLERGLDRNPSDRVLDALARSGLTSRRRNTFTAWQMRPAAVGLRPLWRRSRTIWIR
jgi:transcriptional regulator with XRE-family HTH domain